MGGGGRQIFAPPEKTPSSGPGCRAVRNPESDNLRATFLEAHEKFLTSGKEEDRVDAFQMKKAYDSKLKTLKREANEQIIAQSNNKSKTIWNIINNERASKKSDSDAKWQLNIANEKVEDPEKIAEHLLTIPVVQFIKRSTPARF